jgi:hypothetical protein
MADDTEKDWAWLREEYLRVTPLRRGFLHLMMSAQKPEKDAEFQANMKNFRTRFRRGEKQCLILALRWCIMSRRALPSWVSKELWHASERYYEGQLKSWEGVFGKPFPGKRRKGASTRRKDMEVWTRVEQRYADGANLDDLLFEEVGKEFGFSATTTKNLYYERRRIVEGEERHLLEKGIY